MSAGGASKGGLCHGFVVWSPCLGKTRTCSGTATTVIENGVDLDRFAAEPERPGQRLLFVGSFNHFPNVEAFLFFRDAVWPILRS